MYCIDADATRYKTTCSRRCDSSPFNHDVNRPLERSMYATATALKIFLTRDSNTKCGMDMNVALRNSEKRYTTNWEIVRVGMAECQWLVEVGLFAVVFAEAPGLSGNGDLTALSQSPLNATIIVSIILLLSSFYFFKFIYSPWSLEPNTRL
jgi:hypothetical protein